MIDIARIVGERIRGLRTQKNISQESLALKAGISSSYIGKIERGEKNCSLLSIGKILNALDVTFEDFFKYVQPSNAANENTVLPIIISKLNRLSAHEQREVLELLDVLFIIMKKSDS